VQDYYAFGMQMPGRKLSGGYRYGFNGKENDNEVKGEGNQQDYGMRIYDGRIGKFLSVDPLIKSYPELTPYQFASNRPVDGIDIDGLEYAASANLTIDKSIGKPVLSILSSKNTGSSVISLDVNYNGINYSFNNYFAKLPNGETVAAGAYFNAPENSLNNLSIWVSNYENGIVQNFEDVFVSDKQSKERLLDEISLEWAWALAGIGQGRASRTGSIYSVEGQYTKSGKEYIGRNNTDKPNVNRKANDGRDRTKAKVIDTFDKTDIKEGKYKEQKNMDERGGVPNLDNKRREVNQKIFDLFKVKYEKGRSYLLPFTPESKKKLDNGRSKIDP
jgi:RHS repeat-associated protein